MRNLAVLASGTGSLFESMIERSVPIRVLVVDRPCRAQEIAERAGIQHVLLEREWKSFDRDKYTVDMVNILRQYGAEYVAMAGFMTILGAYMFESGTFGSKCTNIHPSLLPTFKGEHAVRDALAAGVKITGTTIHIATKDLDAGLILAQEPVRVLPGDTEESLHERIKKTERILYPELLLGLMRDELL